MIIRAVHLVSDKSQSATVAMPRGAMVVHAESSPSGATLYCVADDPNPTEMRTFALLDTSCDIPASRCRYVGPLYLFGKLYMFVFELLPPSERKGL